MSRCILIVDDSEPNRRLPALILRQLGHTTLEAEDGASALAVLAEHAIDTVLLDLNLPDMHGREVCLAMRKTEAVRTLRIIAYSSQDELHNCGDPLRLGFDGVLRKPLSRKTLIEVIEATAANALPPRSET